MSQVLATSRRAYPLGYHSCRAPRSCHCKASRRKKHGWPLCVEGNNYVVLGNTPHVAGGNGVLSEDRKGNALMRGDGAGLGLGNARQCLDLGDASPPLSLGGVTPCRRHQAGVCLASTGRRQKATPGWGMPCKHWAAPEEEKRMAPCGHHIGGTYGTEAVANVGWSRRGDAL
ncbi:unnamed protein product [Ilex paraguariensis]|uniref:Uncharacterized protein n=1 Tax=Ilex paraguariensis TaxID=185542 RepID=A0ABC8SWP1_9AQUA